VTVRRSVPVALRPGLPSDAAALAAVFIAAWHAGYRGVVPDSVIDALDTAEWTATLGQRLDASDRYTVVAIDELGTPVGFAGYGDDGEHPGDGYLASLYVHPRAGGTGIGARLLRHALDAMSTVDVRLWVFERNAAARRLYERAGFRPDGPRFNDPRWGVPQVRYLRPARNRPRPLPPLPDVTLPEIRSVEVDSLRRPLRTVFRTALREVYALEAIVVRLDTSDGTGIGMTVAVPQITGETAESIRAAVAGPLTACLTGSHTLSSALDAIASAESIDLTVPDHPSARAAVDLAVHDLAARAAGTDLMGLLGNPAVPVRTDLTVSVDEPGAMADRASRAVADGFDTVKLKLDDAARDLARVSAVHDVLAGRTTPEGRRVRIRLDANQAWTADDAVRLLERLHGRNIGVEFVEQPVAAADLDGLAYVRRRSPFPILADESVFTAADIGRVADASAADLVNVKLLKCGGLGPAREAIATCAQAGLGVIIGCMLEPAEGVAAARTLAATATEGPLAHDLDAGWWVG
jgi:L-alanine-DL-glutamate epimerase-like enolase superfamily enzyme/ribosomal protein S18 acetylase RimI-like enzyme